jgi:hypothetical protein
VTVLAKRLLTFMVVTFAVPTTKRFEPVGGSFRVPIETPFAVAMLKRLVGVHWV